MAFGKMNKMGLSIVIIINDSWLNLSDVRTVSIYIALILGSFDPINILKTEYLHLKRGDHFFFSLISRVWIKSKNCKPQNEWILLNEIIFVFWYIKVSLKNSTRPHISCFTNEIGRFLIVLKEIIPYRNLSEFK